ncbi:MAG: metallophosphoesterase [Nanoarchaeota archaeon]|nr:metallophosphoesterase [Nanoarchaeota archaeon]
MTDTPTKSRQISMYLSKGLILGVGALEENVTGFLAVGKQKGNKTESSSNQGTAENRNPKIKNKEGKENEPAFEILVNHKDLSSRNTVKEFVQHYRKRFNSILQILRTHSEFESPTTISRINNMQPKERVSIAGMVRKKTLTKNNNLIFTIEDLTGTINLLVKGASPDYKGEDRKTKETFAEAKEISLDEILGFTGIIGFDKKIIFVNEIIWPDVPLSKELKKSPVEEYALFLGDIHLGSTSFLEQEFKALLKWVNGEQGNEEISKKIKYVFIVGDIVDGVGIFPSQEEELTIRDIYLQYDRFTELLDQFPKTSQIFICPGNHDAVRIAEPQPAIYEEYCQDLYTKENVTMLSNPSLVNIGARGTFPGFDVLLYHGYSFTYFADSVESIRHKGGLERTDLIMKYLLKRRHLAPTHGSTLYVPVYDEDPLLIKTTPDFFVTGHVHRTTFKNHRSISLINASCWISQTKYQEKVGLIPQPGRAILVNLQTRKGKILNFYDKEKKK